MRIIDADKLSEHKFTRESAKGSDYMRGWNDAIEAIIDNAPTVDTYTEDDVHYAIKEGHEVGYGMAKAKFERPQGEWLEVKEKVPYDYWTVCECSLCKHSWALGELSIEDVKDDYKFCPNCGADMRKETNND